MWRAIKTISSREAHEAGKVLAVAVRAADFYGPDGGTSVISTYGAARLLAGKAATVPYPADQPHDFTYVPDFARALMSLIDAPDDAYGKAWHVPNDAARSLREVLNLAAKLIGVQPRISVLPKPLATILGLFQPELRELNEMRFQWDRPYRVDASKFRARFWSNATPLEQGLQETIAFYRRETSGSGVA
jgi:nucleoside-diphosphate-sugar epimerase